MISLWLVLFRNKSWITKLSLAVHIAKNSGRVNVAVVLYVYTQTVYLSDLYHQLHVLVPTYLFIYSLVWIEIL